MTDVKRALAQFVCDNLETRKRGDGTEFVTRKDDAPDWVQEVCQIAHGDFMPDDWRYSAIQALLCGLSENDSECWEDLRHEICDNNVDVYNGKLLQWVASNLRRAEYVNDAAAELGVPEPFDVYKVLQYGQFHELEEIYNLLVQAITDQADDLED